MFRRAIEHSGLAPERHLLIDDRDDYVQGACSLGMKGVVFTSARALRDTLEDIGLL